MTQTVKLETANKVLKQAAKPKKKAAEPKIVDLAELSVMIIGTMKHVSKLLDEGGDIPVETGVQVRELARKIEKQAERADSRSQQLRDISSALDDISGSFFALADAIKGENSSTRRNRHFL